MQVKENKEGEKYIELDSKKNIRITFRSFKGKQYLDIREFYLKDNQLAPSSKGISLNKEQWEDLKSHLQSITEALDK